MAKVSGAISDKERRLQETSIKIPEKVLKATIKPAQAKPRIRTSTGWLANKAQDITNTIKDNKKKIIGLTGQLNEAKYKRDMSPIGLAKETIKGLPAAAVKVGKAIGGAISGGGVAGAIGKTFKKKK